MIPLYSVASSELCPPDEESVIVVKYDDHLIEMTLNEQRIIPNAWNAGWQKGAEEERKKIIAAIKEYYKVAPKAAEPILRVINEALDTPAETP